MNPEQPQQDPQKPVAYDANGNPLYAAPVQQPQQPAPQPANPAEATPQQQTQPASQQAPQQPQPAQQDKFVSSSSHVTSANESAYGHNYDPRLRSQYANEPNVVHATRDVEMQPHQLSDEVVRRHEESRKAYPHLNLSEGEFVITRIKRHPIGLWLPTIGTISIIVLLLTGLIAYPMLSEDPVTGDVPGIIPITVVIMCLIIMIGIGGYISIWVYLRNTFYLTNESVIQEIQHSLFSKHEQTVSLGSIEDASYKQNGIIQSMLDYGQIRLSTEGEETTYRFQYVSNPKKQIAILNNAVEAFKNGRPVGMDDN